MNTPQPPQTGSNASKKILARLRGALVGDDSIAGQQNPVSSSPISFASEDLNRFLHFSQLLHTARDTHSLVLRIIEILRDDFGFDRAGVALVEGDLVRGILGVGEQGTIEDRRSRSWRLNQPGVWMQFLTSESGYLYTTDAFAREGQTTDGGKPVRHHAHVALRTNEHFLGVITLDNAFTERPFSEDDIKPILSLAQQAAFVLENIQLVDALRDSEERMRSLVTSLTETIYSADIADGLFCPLYFSPRLEALTGYTPEEALAEKDFWINRVCPEDRGKVMEGLEKMRTGTVSASEYRILHRSGETRWVLDSPALMPETEGGQRVNGTLLDITERRELEDSLQQAQKMKTIGTLAGGVAHEFNNMLAIVLGNLEFAREDVPPDSPACASLEKAEAAARRAAHLTKQLLDFSRAKAERLPLNVNGLIRETVELMRSSIGRQITFEVRLDPNVGDIVADAAQIQQVLISLCVNARDAMPNGGQIIVRGQNVIVRDTHFNRPAHLPLGEYVRIQVHDSGTGIDAAASHRIFEPFFTTKPVGKGTGLGLAVAYGIISAHHGWMEVESTPGEGTLFHIYLPSALTAPPLYDDVTAGHRASLLIVDSDAKARETLAGILEEAGFYALTAADGSEALALFWTESERVPLVLIENVLPDMDAASLMKNLRDHKADVQVLLCGERASEAFPALPFLQKPYETNRVRQAVKEALNAAL